MSQHDCFFPFSPLFFSFSSSFSLSFLNRSSSSPLTVSDSSTPLTVSDPIFDPPPVVLIVPSSSAGGGSKLFDP